MYDNEVLIRDATSSREHSGLGQMSEVQWLQQLTARVQHRNEATPILSSTLGGANFYADEKAMQLPHGDNPFHLPSDNIATVLFQCYFQTVQTAFPIVPADVEEELQIYYHTVRNTRDVSYPPHWYAMVNLILAIGARFSRLIEAEWHTDLVDETVYVSRAHQLMGLNDTVMTLAAPDLPLIRVRLCNDANSFYLLSITGFWPSCHLLHVYWSYRQVSIVLLQSC
jgi:hypothetical protein